MMIQKITLSSNDAVPVVTCTNSNIIDYLCFSSLTVGSTSTF